MPPSPPSPPSPPPPGRSTRRTGPPTKLVWALGIVVGLAVTTAWVLIGAAVTFLVVDGTVGTPGIDDYLVVVEADGEGAIAMSLVACPGDRVEAIEVTDTRDERTYWRVEADGDGVEVPLPPVDLTGPVAPHGFDPDGDPDPLPDDEGLVAWVTIEGETIGAGFYLPTLPPGVPMSDGTPVDRAAERSDLDDWC